MPSFAYGSPETLTDRLPPDAQTLWEDVPELQVWDTPEFALRTAAHELGRVATIGTCFATEEAYAEALASALEQDKPEALTTFPGHYTTVFIRPGETIVLRDVAGINPVYFGDTADQVIVSSQPSVVADYLKVKPDYIAAHIALPAWHGNIAGNETCFEGILRLGGGQALRVEENGAHLSTYEPLNPEPFLTLEEGARRLRTALRDSVSMRMRSGIATRANLSGGKDSSSIVALALEDVRPDEELSVYFMDDPDLQRGDRDYVEAYVEADPRLKLTSINSHNTVIAPDFEAIKQPEDLALAVPPHRFQVVRDIYGPSIERGPGLHFSGNGGDEVMGIGSSHLPDLLRKGRLMRVLSESITRAKVRNVSPVDIWKDVVSFATQGTRGSLRKTAETLGSGQEFNPFATVYESINPMHINQTSAGFLTDAARDAVAQSLKNRAMSMGNDRDPTLGQYLARARVHTSAMGQAIEAFCVNQDSKVFVEAPLLDNEVVRVALAVDVQQKGDPYTFKPILQHAMEGILPDAILNRNTKGIYDPHNARLHTESLRGLTELMKDSRLVKMGIIDAERVCATLPLLSSLPMSTVWALEQVMTTELWLRSLERAGLAEAKLAYADQTKSVADVESQAQMFEGTFVLPDYVHAVASPSGTLTLFNRKTNTYSPLSQVQSHMLRVFAAYGSADAVVDSLAQRYPRADRRQLIADTHRILGEFADLHIIEESATFTSRDLPSTAQSPRFMSGESKVTQAIDNEHSSRLNRVLATVALAGAMVLKTLMPNKRLEILKRLQGRKGVVEANQAESRDILKAVQGIKYLGRLACLESSYASALALALKKRHVDWHVGASFYPVGYHSWIEAEGTPVRTSTEGEVVGDFQSFFSLPND
ncbi:MAG TPA: lasso peptide biosynthesis B2 protein [Candidatus Saccharimonadales bacterium]|nr:lasso peptide biosynthesis B2 protein [Candidatus Saccharimonadales bacterium]